MTTLLEDEPCEAAVLPAARPVTKTIAFDFPRAWCVTVALLAVVTLLVALSVLGQVSTYLYAHPRMMGLVELFYVDLESNVPTWYSSLAMAFCAALLSIIAAAKWKARDSYRLHWWGLSALMLALSADEIAMIHEFPIDPLRESLHAGGAFYYTWVIPGAAFVAVIGICFLRFLVNLPARTRWTMFAGGAVFILGVIVIEMISGWQADRYGEANFAYSLIVTAEELCEMLGIVIFAHAVVDYIHREMGGLRFSLAAR